MIESLPAGTWGSMLPRAVTLITAALLATACVADEPDPGPRSCGEPSEPCTIADGSDCLGSDPLAPTYVQIAVDVIAEYGIGEVFMITGFERLEVAGDASNYYPRLRYRYTTEGFDQAGDITWGPSTPAEWEAHLREVLAGVVAGPMVDEDTVQAALHECDPEIVYEPCEHDELGYADGAYRPLASVVLFKSCDSEISASVDRVTGELVECSDSAACDNGAD